MCTKNVGFEYFEKEPYNYFTFNFFIFLLKKKYRAYDIAIVHLSIYP